MLMLLEIIWEDMPLKLLDGVFKMELITGYVPTHGTLALELMDISWFKEVLMNVELKMESLLVHLNWLQQNKIENFNKSVIVYKFN